MISRISRKKLSSKTVFISSQRAPELNCHKESKCISCDDNFTARLGLKFEYILNSLSQLQSSLFYLLHIIFAHGIEENIHFSRN